MIAVIESQCKGASHEKVNSGFLTLLRRAYPDEPISFYCDRSHGDAIRAVLRNDDVAVDGVDYLPIALHDQFEVRGALLTYRQLGRIFRELILRGTRQILFLSMNPVLLHIVKRLRARPELEGFRFVFVLHADFEDIANQSFAEPSAPAVPEPTLRQKLRMIRPGELPSKVVGFLRNQVRAHRTRFFKERFREREQLSWQHSPDFRYIALAPHARANAAEYIDVDALGVFAIDMPINFAPPAAAPKNEHMKFATFGYGDVTSLAVVARSLAARPLTRPYEIRIIGMDNRGLENVKHVSYPSPGKVLPRPEMERLAEDIDAFLILYDRGRYRLSCSGSIFEAFSYVKPVLHLGNACVDAFDPPEAPIGFRHDRLEELADTMAAMIEDPAAYRLDFELRRRNLLALRTRLSMDALAPRLRAILDFSTT